MNLLGFTYSNGTALCTKHATDTSDSGNESGEAYAVYNTENATSTIMCDECETVILEGSSEDE